MGVGSIALASLINPQTALADRDQGAAGVLTAPHHPPRAKQIIFLFQSGGPSQIDLLDYKPHLNKVHGQQLPDAIRKGQRLTGMSGNQSSLPLVGSPFKFQQHGEIGTMDQRSAAVYVQDRRRPVHCEINVHRSHQPRSRRNVYPNGFPVSRSAQFWRLAELWPGQPKRELAFVRRHGDERTKEASPWYPGCGGAGFCRRDIRPCGFDRIKTRCFT